MVSERKPATDLADPAAALVNYLDDLLHTATSTALDDTVEVPQQVDSPASEKADPQPKTPPAVEAAPTPEPEPFPVPPEEPVAAVVAEPEREEVKPVAPAVDVPAPPAPLEPEASPDWAGRPFECLIFKVAGLQLAVPLVLLGAIHRIDDRIKPIPGRPPWYMGMLLDRNQKLKVVDSAEWIMSGRVPDSARDGYRFVIRLDDSDWALACDEVAESFTLDPGQVRWRTSRSKRPWLAGTVVQHMCALIDVGAMAHLLARAEREQHLELD